MRRVIAAAALALTLGASTVACSCEPWAAPSDVEIEDCDAEDYRNKEAECGFTDADRKTPATKPKTPAKRKP